MSSIFGAITGLFGGGGGGKAPQENAESKQQTTPSRKQATPARSPVKLFKAEERRATSTDDVLASLRGTLNQYCKSTRAYEQYEDEVCELRVVVLEPNDDLDYRRALEVVTVARPSVAILTHELQPEAEPINFDLYKMFWVTRGGLNLMAWGFFVDASQRGGEDARAFAEAFVRADVEVRRQDRFDRAVGKKPADLAYAVESLKPAPTPSRYAARDADDEDDEDYKFAVDDDDEVTGDEDEDGRGFGRAAPTPSRPLFPKTPGTAERNGLMAVGLTNNRTFVMRGPKVGVFKHNLDDELEYVGQIGGVQTSSGKSFTPARAMLHERDRRLLMLNPEDEERVFCLDLETEKVVEEWHVGDAGKIRNMGATEKYSQRTDEQLVMGVNNNSVFTLDPRLSGNKLAQKQTYAKAPGLSCVASDGMGRTAAGSKTGEIRLYNNIEKRAKTMLPGLGDAITGLDVTEDGQWILATTATYLLVVSSVAEEGDASGFDKPMAADKRPVPFKLQLRPEDVAKYGIDKVNFTPAHFNTGEGVVEDWIVTSTGPYIITWNFRRLKKYGHLEYEVRREYQDVVADQFRYGMADQVVVTLTDDVLMQHRERTRK